MSQTAKTHDEAAMSIDFELDGQPVSAAPGETIWQVAKRAGTDIPHLCYADEPGYRADGNCRACMVEIDGEGALAASCIREPTPGMKVSSASSRAASARKMVFEMLLADQPAREVAHEHDSSFWHWSDHLDLGQSRMPARAAVGTFPSTTPSWMSASFLNRTILTDLS